ncbi:hypothetical protein MLD38_001631 [Melastoma candidum]|uniref:Uncharacterized protein n=1 Tax=Melastoma candidum TaxID=119954 RepID=A0ACB9SD68_9MYRT|nr:hypothetical protein MLD38_001631 [Melastoma candidum]
MTMAPTFSFLKITPPPSSPYPNNQCCCYSSSSTHLSIRCYSQAEGPLRRPVAPSPPSPPTPTLTEPTPPSVVSPPPPPPPSPSPLQSNKVEEGSVITLEFQRQKAKELQEYFREKKLQEANQGPFFGFLPKNEISNGRWAMFGFAVGMLTEYATGSDFVDQVKILLSNFGILDLE